MKTFLIISGLILALIGAAILLVPEAMHALNGVDLGGRASLLNEVRAPGGALLASGVVIILGAFKSRFTYTAAIFSIVIYLGYGLARILSIAIDGTPSTGLMIICGLEIIIGLTGVFVFLKYRQTAT